MDSSETKIGCCVHGELQMDMDMTYIRSWYMVGWGGATMSRINSCEALERFNGCGGYMLWLKTAGLMGI